MKHISFVERRHIEHVFNVLKKLIRIILLFIQETTVLFAFKKVQRTIQNNKMNLSRDRISLSEPIARDPYGRYVFVLKRNDNDKELFVTKVLIDEVSHYISFPVEIEPSIVHREQKMYYVYSSLPRFFDLREDNESNSGVIVLTLRDSDDSFYVENRVLVELKGE